MIDKEAASDAPDWDDGGRVHNWKNYVSDELREMWAAFTPEQRLAIARNADEMADREEWD